MNFSPWLVAGGIIGNAEKSHFELIPRRGRARVHSMRAGCAFIPRPIIRPTQTRVVLAPRAKFKLLSKQRRVSRQRRADGELNCAQRIKLKVKSAGFAVAPIIWRFHADIFGVYYDAQKTRADNSVAGDELRFYS